MNPAAREELFAKWTRDHGAILHRVVQAFAARDDRQDLMQDVMLALWRALPAFRGESSAPTFMYRVAHNTALTWQRARRQHRRRVDVAGEIDWMARPDVARGRADTPARLEALYAAIRELPPLDRSLIVLSLDGLSYREIATIHGLSETNVGARLTRVRQRLTQQLTEEKSDAFESAR